MNDESWLDLPFHDRAHAGRVLSRALQTYAGAERPIVLALPRGGVPVGFEVAKALRLPLDVFLVRKLGVPGREELAMGAIASGGVRVLNREVLSQIPVTSDAIARVTATEERELRRRETLYRKGRPPLDVRGRTVFVVDDGLATGTTMRAACTALARLEPREIVVAVPVGAEETCADLQDVADEVVCVTTPAPFYAVGQWYREFAQTTDEEVSALLVEAESFAREQPSRLREEGDADPSTAWPRGRVREENARGERA